MCICDLNFLRNGVVQICSCFVIYVKFWIFSEISIRLKLSVISIF
jgi:hypothetical protein